jgi:hypothetical protein
MDQCTNDLFLVSTFLGFGFKKRNKMWFIRTSAFVADIFAFELPLHCKKNK